MPAGLKISHLSCPKKERALILMAEEQGLSDAGLGK
jgi:hypothetical protein